MKKFRGGGEPSNKGGGKEVKKLDARKVVVVFLVFVALTILAAKQSPYSSFSGCVDELCFTITSRTDVRQVDTSHNRNCSVAMVNDVAYLDSIDAKHVFHARWRYEGKNARMVQGDMLEREDIDRRRFYLYLMHRGHDSYEQAQFLVGRVRSVVKELFYGEGGGEEEEEAQKLTLLVVFDPGVDHYMTKSLLELMRQLPEEGEDFEREMNEKKKKNSSGEEAVSSETKRDEEASKEGRTTKENEFVNEPSPENVLREEEVASIIKPYDPYDPRDAIRIEYQRNLKVFDLHDYVRLLKRNIASMFKGPSECEGFLKRCF